MTAWFYCSIIHLPWENDSRKPSFVLIQPAAARVGVAFRRRFSLVWPLCLWVAVNLACTGLGGRVAPRSLSGEPEFAAGGRPDAPTTPENGDFVVRRWDEPIATESELEQEKVEAYLETLNRIQEGKSGLPNTVDAGASNRRGQPKPGVKAAMGAALRGNDGSQIGDFGSPMTEAGFRGSATPAQGLDRKNNDSALSMEMPDSVPRPTGTRDQVGVQRDPATAGGHPSGSEGEEAEEASNKNVATPIGVNQPAALSRSLPPPPKLLGISVQPATGPPSFQDSGGGAPHRSDDAMANRGGGANVGGERAGSQISAEGLGPYAERVRSGQLHLSPIEAAWQLTLISLLDGRTTDSADSALGASASQSTDPKGSSIAVPTIDSRSGEVLRAFGQLGQAVLEQLRHPRPGATDRTLMTLRGLENQIARDGDLNLPFATLCRRVWTFGRFEVMEGDLFIAGQENRTILYCEVESASAVLAGDNLYHGRLNGQLELFDESGRVVWQSGRLDYNDVCRRPRRDFFIAQEIILPPTILPGNYTLKFRLEDAAASKGNEINLAISLQSLQATAP